MTDSKHTPESWFLEGDLIIDNADGYVVAEVPGRSIGFGWEGSEEQLRRALLMTAAPELLAACEALANAEVRMVDGLEVLDGDLHQYVELARDAIAKAKGQI
jgi:hypothetical protein